MKKTFLYIILMVITTVVFSQNVYVVTKTTDPNPFTDKFNNDDNLCDPDMYGTLQWAINKVNYNGGESRIEFNIPGSGVHEISSNSYFPQIKNPVVIDGTSQSGYTPGNPVIKITGQMKTQYGFNVYNTTVTIKGLHISNFANSAVLLTRCSNSKILDNKICNIASSGYGLQVFESNYTEIYGNRIEVDALPAYGRSSFGIFVDKSEYCIVGGTEAGKANTIANCYKAGVFINGYKFNKVSGNIIYNNPKAILLGTNANDNIQPPVINSYTNGILSGTALPNSTVEVFGSTGEENANEYLGSVVADGDGDWSAEITINNVYNFCVALQTDYHNNTSTLCAVFTIVEAVECTLGCLPAYSEQCNIICNSNMYCPDGYDCGLSELPPGWCSSHGSANGMNWDNPPSFLPTQVGGYISFTGCGGGDPFDPENPYAQHCPSLRGEGVMTKFLSDLVVGQQYKLSFYRAHEGEIEDFHVKFIDTELVGLPDGLDDWTLPDINPVPGICETIYHEQPNSNSFVWDYEEIYFTANSAYDGLWLYCEVNTEHNYGATFINGVKLIPILDATDEITFGPACVNYGSILQLSILNEDAIEYEWIGPNAFHSNESNPIVSISAEDNMAGTYYLTVTFVNDCIYRAHFDVPISHVEVGIRFGTPGFGDNFYPGNEVTICPYENRFIRAVSDPVPPSSQLNLYEWNTGFSELTYWSSININNEPPFLYTVTVTDYQGCTASSQFTVNHHPVPPTPTVTNSGPVCAGGSVVFTADHPQVFDQNLSYLWHRYGVDFISNSGLLYINDVENTLFCNAWSSEEEYLIYGMDGGDYKLIVTNQYGCESSATTYVEVVPQIAGCISANNDGAYCYGDEIILFVDHPIEGAGLDTEYIYEWSGPNGFTSNELIASPGNANPLTAGTYYLTITPYTENHIQMPQCTQVLTTEVVVLDLLDLLYYHQSPYCVGDLVKLIPTPVLDGVTYNWYNQDGFVTSDQELVYEYATTDLTGPYYYTVTTGSGCLVTSEEAYIHVDPAPELSIEVLNNINLPDLGSVMIHYESEELYGYYMTVTHHSSETMVYWGNVNIEYIQIDNLQAGQYDIVVESFNGCQKEYTFFILGPTSDIELICNVKPRTCNSTNIAIVEFTINGGDPPYNVNIYADDILVSEGNVYNNPGTYSIEIENLPTPTYLINIVATDIFSQEAISECGNYVFAWMPGDQVTNENLQSSYSGVTLYIGDEDNQTLNVNQDVTFKYCTIYCATFDYNNVAETKWKVATPYDLKFVNCTIKSGCDDKMWDGIDVLGSNLPQNYNTHAYVEVLNTEMSDAIKGLESYQGGIINTKNSVYNDNVYDICFNVFENTHTLEKIENNTFVTEGPLNNPNLFPKAHVYLNMVSGISFSKNHFTNNFDANLPSVQPYYANMKGKGIEAIFSSFTVTPVIYPFITFISFNRNYFNGLYYAIDAQGQKTYAPQINHCEFTNNFRGIHLKATNGARVLYNKIYTTEENLTVDAIPPVNNGTPQDNVTYATYLNGAKNTWFEENKIFNGMAGAYIYNSDDNGGTRYYRNDFGGEIVSNNVINNKGMNAASIVVGKNSNWNAANPPVYITGLEVRCNDYTGNDYAISVLNGNMRKDQGVYQGQTDQLAGNQFHTAMVNGKEFKVQITHGTIPSLNFSQYDLGIYNYYQHDDNNDDQIFHRELNPARIVGVDDRLQEGIPYYEPMSCKSHFGLNIFDHRTAISDISIRKNSLTGLQTQYDDVVDNGDTEYMLSLAENLSPHNFKQYVPQLSNDGYLSDTVFSTLLENRTAQKPVIASVFIANSPLPTEIMEKVENSTYLSNGHKNQIRAYQVGMNNRVLLEKEISGIQQEIFNIEGELVNNVINNDSISEAVAEVVNYFYSKPSLVKSDYIQLFTLQNSIGNFDEASSTLNNLRSHASTLNSAEADEINRYCDVNEIYLTFIDSVSDLSVLMNNKQFLLESALASSADYSAMAEVLYSFTTDSIFLEYTPLPTDIIAPRNTVINENLDENETLSYNVYPIPAKDLVFVEYSFEENYSEAAELLNETIGKVKDENCNFGIIKLYSTEGKLINTYALSSASGKETIHISDLKPGNYILEIEDCYGNTRSSKITKF